MNRDVGWDYCEVKYLKRRNFEVINRKMYFVKEMRRLKSIFEYEFSWHA